MAKTWIKAKKQFTRRIGPSMVVGHPKHPDVRGRYAEVDEGPALDNLIASGHAELINHATYTKAMEEDGPNAHDVRLDQLAGRQPRAAITMGDSQLAELASQRGVDISGAEKRSDVVKLINAKIDEKAEPAAVSDTRDTTNHPPESGINADVTAAGTTDRKGFSTTGMTSLEGEGAGEIAEEEAAPTRAPKAAAKAPAKAAAKAKPEAAAESK